MELLPEDITRVLRWYRVALSGLAMEVASEDSALADKLRGAHARETPVVFNSSVHNGVVVGDYVFASRWLDCCPQDPWCVGYVETLTPPQTGSSLRGGSSIRGGSITLKGTPERSWRYAMKITREQGIRILREFPIMERQDVDYAAIAKVFGVAPSNPDYNEGRT